jgi:hypothetical protein
VRQDLSQPHGRGAQVPGEPTGAPILVGFNAGRTTQELSGWSDDEILESALGTLDRMFP